MNVVSNDPTTRGTGDAPRAARLVFSYEGETLKLVSQNSLQMVPPPSDPLSAGKKESGFWYELRDAKEKTLYRRVIQNPIRHYAEVHSDDPDHPLTWEKSSKPSGLFELLVPEMRAARQISIFSSPAGPGMPEPAREIARFAIQWDQKRKEG